LTKEIIASGPREVRKFGLLFALICTLVAGYSFYKSGTAWPYFAGGAVFFLLTGLFVHAVLRPIYIGWMKFAFVLAWINTRILLGIFFYGIITPTGLLMRLFGKDLLDKKIDRSASSYWQKRDPAPIDRSRYERLF
jgi:hypothetical protein